MRNFEKRLWKSTKALAWCVLAFNIWCYNGIYEAINHKELDGQAKQAVDIPVTDVTDLLTPEELGQLEVGQYIELDKLGHESNKRMVAKRKMSLLKNELNKQAVIASLPPELPRSLTKKRKG